MSKALDVKAIAQISAVEETLAQLPQVEIPVRHHFSKDVYAREITIPADSFVVGKIHKHENLNILSKGSMLLVSKDGAVHVKAPYTVVSSPGVKRLAYTLEECVWTTIHGTSETDLDKIEEAFIAKTYNDVEGIGADEIELITKEIEKLKGESLCHGSLLALRAPR